MSQKYTTGRDVKNIKRKSLIPGLVLISCFGLAAILSTPDQDDAGRRIEREMNRETITQQSAYQDSLPNSLNSQYEGK